VRPAAGEIEFAGRRIEKLAPHAIVRLGLGYVPEDRRIFTDLTVAENLEVGRRPPHVKLEPWTPERLFRLFPNLAEMRGRPGGRMSGGEQQMLTIGRALMTNPDLLILDEATEGLAPLIAQDIWRIVRDIRAGGIATIVVDKNFAAVSAVADRIVVLVKGRVVFEGASGTLRDDDELRHRHLGV
jgi:branched-chain amino acid transport system ATP-binding protein